MLLVFPKSIFKKKIHIRCFETPKNVNIRNIKKVLLQQQKSQVEEMLANAQVEHINRCAIENQISLNELDDILQPIIDSCTKDSIANGNYYLKL